MDWKSLLTTAINFALPAILIPLFINYILPLLMPATGKLFDWISTQEKNVKNTYIQGMLTRLTDLVKADVLAFENTFIEDLKVKVAAGNISASDIPTILKAEKDKFLAAIKDKANAQGIWEIVKAVAFSGDEPAFMKWLEGIVEAIVAQLPPSGLQTPTATSASAVQIAAAKTVPQPAAA